MQTTSNDKSGGGGDENSSKSLILNPVKSNKNIRQVYRQNGEYGFLMKISQAYWYPRKLLFKCLPT